MNVKMLAIVGSVVGLGLLGLGTQTAKADGLTVRISLGAPTYCPPQQVVYQQPQVVYQQAPQQVVYQQAPQVIYQQAPQVVYQPVPQQVLYQPAYQVVIPPTPACVDVYRPRPEVVYYRPEPRYERHDFDRHDDRGRVDVRIGSRW